MMTLDDLIKAVEAGDDEAFKDIIIAMESEANDRGKNFPRIEMLCAYLRGSLDAAKALHDELLPGWWFSAQPTGATVWKVDTPHDGMVFTGAPASAPARAWLLAILKAKQAEGAA